MKKLPVGVLDDLPAPAWDGATLNRRWNEAVADLRRIYRKILVLDDDPTGSQTVYDIPVYTGFETEDLVTAWRDPSHMVYVLTNSRSLHPEQSETLHRRLMRNWIAARDRAGHPGAEFLVISRSDSTLRGHYPLEPRIIREEYSRAGGGHLAEILYPFFPEGGRYTLGGVHYVREGDALVPAGQTEFARDSSFGYTESDIRRYVEEKTEGRVPAEAVRRVDIEMIRNADVRGIAGILTGLSGEHRAAVDSADYGDVKIFVIAFAAAVLDGARFVFRSAAGVVKILAGLEDRPLLGREELLAGGTRGTKKTGEIDGTRDAPGATLTGPGLLIVGSYVRKTTRQLAALTAGGGMAEVTLNVREALHADRFPTEVERARREVDALLKEGKNVALYTVNAGGRKFLRAGKGDEDLSDLELSARISSGLVEVVAGLKNAPSWVITKGGITSHDIAVHALRIRVASVLGQIIPGVPVWRLGPESRWPGLPLVIFPGNVGDENALKRAVQLLTG